jgi:hypothetical protein
MEQLRGVYWPYGQESYFQKNHRDNGNLEGNSTLPTSVGIVVEFVAKPMPYTMAAGLPTKFAIACSSSSCKLVLPANIAIHSWNCQ